MNEITYPALDDELQAGDLSAVDENEGMESETTDDALITRPFDPARIKINTQPALIAGLVKRIDYNEIDLAPAFQRKARLWKPENKSRLIESLLLKIPLPVFYVAEDENGNWAVVDGIQRLTTIHDFVKGKYALSSLEYLTQLDKLEFEHLPRPMQRRIEETSLVVNVIQDGTPEEVMINIFKRINTGGMPLSAQEIRNALYKGGARKILQDIAKSSEFRLAHGNSVSDARMGAQELALRFLAFYSRPWQQYVEQKLSLDEFLSQEMRILNSKNQTELASLARHFLSVMEHAVALLGSHAFRKSLGTEGRRSPINRALFEAIGVTLARLNGDQIQLLHDRKKTLLQALRSLLDDERFSAAISSATGSSANVEVRFSRIEQTIDEVLQ